VSTISKNNEFDNAIFECCAPFFKRFKMNGILRRFYAVKHKGVAVYVIFLFLTGLVFSRKNLYGIIDKEPERIDFEKDVVYRVGTAVTTRIPSLDDALPSPQQEGSGCLWRKFTRTDWALLKASSYSRHWAVFAIW